MEVEIVNLTDEKIEEIPVMKKALDKAVEIEGLNEAIFQVIIVSKEEIHRLNKTYRHIDRVTDVITFALEDEKEMISPIRVLGDIYICLEQAKNQAKEYGHSLARELSFLAVHGFYHLLGYDHMTKMEEEIMMAKQEEVLKQCGILR